MAPSAAFGLWMAPSARSRIRETRRGRARPERGPISGEWLPRVSGRLSRPCFSIYVELFRILMEVPMIHHENKSASIPELEAEFPAAVRQAMSSRRDPEAMRRAAVLMTSQQFEERSKQPHCIPFRAGEFGLSKDCVAQGESLFSIRREELGEDVGSLDEERWRVLVKALGNMMGSDCEPA